MILTRAFMIVFMYKLKWLAWLNTFVAKPFFHINYMYFGLVSNVNSIIGVFNQQIDYALISMLWTMLLIRWD